MNLSSPFSFLKGACIAVQIILLFLGACDAQGRSQWLDDPSGFFTTSNPVISYVDGQFQFDIITPVATLCALHYRKITESSDTVGPGSPFDGAVMQSMTSPSEFHLVNPPFEAGSLHEVILTAFFPGGFSDLIQSGSYVVQADPSNPDLVVDGAPGSMTVPFAPCAYDLSVVNVTQNGATFELSSNPTTSTVSSLAFGISNETSQTIALSRTEATAPLQVPDLFLVGLDPGTPYEVVGCFLDTMVEVCCAGPTPFLEFQTEEAEEDPNNCFEDNVALLSLGASIADVSSNWNNGGLSSSFGGNNAIDGDSSSQWSSAADGDDAFITVALPEATSVAGVGVWSREMVGSSEILTFQITLIDSSTGESTVLGPFDLPDTHALYKYDLQVETEGELYDQVRLDAVTTTGINTGLRSLEVYPKDPGCSSTHASALVANPKDPPTSSAAVPFGIHIWSSILSLATISMCLGGCSLK